MTKSELKSKYKRYNDKQREYHKKYARKIKRTKTFKYLAANMNYWYKNGIITSFDLWKIAKRQKLLCPFTGQKLTVENISVDHFISKSKGGLNIPSNIRLVVKSINTAKQTMTDDEFINLCKCVVNYAGGGTTPPTV